MSGLDPSDIGTPRSKRSVIYVRESPGAIEAQVDSLWRWEEENVDASRPCIWVREDPTLEPGDTPTLDRIERLIRHKRIGMLVVWRLDRLSKPIKRTAELILRLAERHDCRFVSVDDMIDTSLPSGKLFVRQLASMRRFTDERRPARSLLVDNRGRIKKTGPTKRTLRLAPRVERMLNNGKSQWEVANSLNISRDLIYRMIYKYGLVNVQKL